MSACPYCGEFFPTKAHLLRCWKARLADAAPIVAAMRGVPEERRLDAVATAVDAFCQTGGKLAT